MKNPGRLVDGSAITTCSLEKLKAKAQHDVEKAEGRKNAFIDLIGCALNHIENFKAAISDQQPEKAYLEMLQAQILLYYSIPRVPEYKKYQTKASSQFYERYLEMRAYVQKSEYLVIELEQLIRAKSKKDQQSFDDSVIDNSQNRSHDQKSQGSEKLRNTKSNASHRNGHKVARKQVPSIPNDSSLSATTIVNGGGALSSKLLPNEANQSLNNSNFEYTPNPSLVDNIDLSGLHINSTYVPPADLSYHHKHTFPPYPVDDNERDILAAKFEGLKAPTGRKPAGPRLLGASERSQSPNKDSTESVLNKSDFDHDQHHSFIYNLGNTSNKAPTHIYNGTPPAASTTISPDHLNRCIEKIPEKLLILDLRFRKDFELSHIATMNIVGIDPLSIHGSTSKDLEDALIVSPEHEYTLFTQRHLFDLVVIVDESSVDLKNNGNVKIKQLYDMIYLDEYEKILKRPPCVLIGGMKAWVARFGSYRTVSIVSQYSDPNTITYTYPSNPTLPQEIPSRPYGTKKGSVASVHRHNTAESISPTSPYVKDLTDYFKISPTSTKPHSFKMPPLTQELQQHHYPQQPQQSIQPQPHFPRNEQYQSQYYQSQPLQYQHHHPQLSEQPYLQLQQQHYPPQMPQSNNIYSNKVALHRIPNTSYDNLLMKNSAVSKMQNSFQGSKDQFSTHINYPPLIYTSSGGSTSNLPPTNMQSKTSAGSVMPMKPKPAVEFVTGLANLGNTCYMNCILQCLAGTPELARPFIEGTYSNFINLNSRLGYKGALARSFASLVQMMASGKYSYVEPTAIKSLCGSFREAFRGNAQQDAQEFLTFILDGLHEELNSAGDAPRLKELTPKEERKRETMGIRQVSTIEWGKYLKTDYSLIVDTFQGQYVSKLRCLTCGFTSTTYSPFSSVTLPIPAHGKQVSLIDCFRLLTAEEILEGDNAWFCPHCKQPRRSSKVLSLARLPFILIIHLKRFHGMNKKLETFVHYPLYNLDLTPFWPPLVGDDIESMEPFRMYDQMGPFKYNLYAVTNHQGTLCGGHYTSYVKKGTKGWCYFDDAKVSRNVNPDSGLVGKNAYVIFYTRVLPLH